MNNELKIAFSWLEHTHEVMKELAEDNRNRFSSDYLQGYAAGLDGATKHYGKEIERIRQLIEGYMIEDVNLGGDEDVAV